MPANVYDTQVRKINGQDAALKDYAGKVLLIVNVASKCGLTPQYDGLEKTYEKYHDKGFEVLAFPANEFGAQEPGSNEEIQEFCRSSFGVKFPLFEKIVVKGPEQHPLYKLLVQAQPKARPGLATTDGDFEKKLAGYGIKRENPSDILWNFEKFLINRRGQVVARFSPDVTPDDPELLKAIETELSH
jgi:glutathione peroxidase